MMIVIEGPDAAGKSTLAKVIAKSLQCDIQESEGPPRSEHDLDDRCRRYVSMTGTLFVRHPAISNPIYRVIHGKPGPSDSVIADFYRRKPFIIYCDPGERGLTDHVIKPGEDPEFLEKLQAKQWLIREEYRKWAIGRAHLVYRIGDDMDLIANIVYWSLR